MKRTLQRNKRSRAKTHGFFARAKNPKGILILKRRRTKGRKVLTA